MSNGFTMTQIEYDIIMKALREVNPELFSVIDSLKDRNTDNDRVKTFEDCARVEQDIMNRLASANPFNNGSS